jgi:hypothetical protein
LAVIATVTVPLPFPVPPDWIEIQGDLLTARHVHVFDAFTCSCSVVAPAIGSRILFGVTEKPHTCFV